LNAHFRGGIFVNLLGPQLTKIPWKIDRRHGPRLTFFGLPGCRSEQFVHNDSWTDLSCNLRFFPGFLDISSWPCPHSCVHSDSGAAPKN